MLCATLALMLHSLPVAPAFLTGDVPTRVRLVDVAEDPTPNYETWTRVQLRTEYDRLDDLRPGIGIPLTLILGGVTGTAITSIWFVSAATAFFGIEVTLAAALGISIVIFAGLAVVGTILLVRLWPERKAINHQMDTIEDIYRAGFWRSPQKPCPETPGPVGPPPTVPPVPEYRPSQVGVPAIPITVATF